MQLPTFQNAYFLQSVGWSIANSFWQTAILWLIYQTIVTFDKKMSSLVKHHFSVTLMFISFIWFVYTTVENYFLLSTNTGVPTSALPKSLIYQLQRLIEVLPFLSIIYFAILFLYSLQFLKRLSANNLLHKKGLTKPIIDIRLFIRHTAKHLGMRKDIHVWISSYVDVPSVTGFFKPIILLPAAIVNDLSVNQVEAILLHELAHIKRDDYIINLFQTAIEMVLFFNPFVLLIGKAARKERENCCDDWVLNFQYDKLAYAQALLKIEERRHFKLAFVLAATDNKKILLQRIKRLFANNIQSPNLGTRDRFKFIGLATVLTIGIFTTIPELSTKNSVKHAKSAVPILYNTTFSTPVLKGESISKDEIIEKNVIKTDPILTINSEKTRILRPMVKVKAAKQGIKTYVNAYINEELLPENSNNKPPTPTLVVDKETDVKKYYIKIEEQVSGNPQTNTYYLELNNKDGGANLKPLIILEKLNISTSKIKTEKHTDSTLAKHGKRRITS